MSLADELNWRSATELARLIRSKAVSPVELLRSCLETIWAHAEPQKEKFCIGRRARPKWKKQLQVAEQPTQQAATFVSFHNVV